LLQRGKVQFLAASTPAAVASRRQLAAEILTARQQRGEAQSTAYQGTSPAHQLAGGGMMSGSKDRQQRTFPERRQTGLQSLTVLTSRHISCGA
jgi:hypothetical protein